MQATVFEPVFKLYRLKVPSRKLLSNKIIKKAHTLALGFYTHLFSNIIRTKTTGTLLAQYEPVSESIREAYTSMFYSFKTINQSLLDFIACIICLLSDAIFAAEQVQENEPMLGFLEGLSKDNQKLREYLFILYTAETLGYKVGKESAALLFDRFIISQNHFQSNLGNKLRINLQLKEFKANLEKKYVDIRPRLKKKTRNVNVCSFQNEISDIMAMSKMEAEEESKKNRKFQRLMEKCATEGDDLEKSVKKSTSVSKFSNFLKNIKNCKLFISKAKKNKDQKEQSRSFEHWRSVLDEMRNNSYLKKKQQITALSPSYLSSIAPSSQHLHNGPQERLIKRSSPKNEPPPQRSMQAKKTVIRYENVLPDIKQYRQHIIVGNENDQNQDVNKSVSYNSRRLKEQLSHFITERRNKRIC